LKKAANSTKRLLEFQGKLTVKNTIVIYDLIVGLTNIQHEIIEIESNALHLIQLSVAFLLACIPLMVSGIIYSEIGMLVAGVILAIIGLLLSARNCSTISKQEKELKNDMARFIENFNKAIEEDIDFFQDTPINEKES